MKTKELIRRLQEADPAGEEECVVGNHDIFFVENLPAYYDGRRQQLVRDPSKAPYYDVVGARITGTGRKVQIHTLSVADALENNPDMPVELDNADCYAAKVARWRQEARER